MKTLLLAAALAALLSAPAYAQSVGGQPVGPTNPLPTQSQNPSSLYTAQQGMTATATPLPAQPLVNGVSCTAGPANTGTVYIGPAGETSATGFPLLAGQSIPLAVTNLSTVNVLDSVSTDTIACYGN